MLFRSLIPHAEFVPGRSFYLELEPGEGFTVSQPEVSVVIHAAGAEELVDSDADALPDAWEIAHFGDLSQSADEDPDGDNQSNLLEYLRGSSPEVPDHYFGITSIELTDKTVTVTLTSDVGAQYDVYISSDLVNWIRPFRSAIVATGPYASAAVLRPASSPDDRLFIKVIPRGGD